VPITGATPREAADKFCGILNSLLTGTITKRPLMVRTMVPRAKVPIASLAFRDRRGLATWQTIESRAFGTLRLFVSHECGFNELANRLWELESIKYAYHLATADDSEPFLRWEYEKYPPANRKWCRHHIQGPVDVIIGGQAYRLDRFHTPTGFVTVEEIVQFLIQDLKVVTKHRDTWHDVVTASYRQFQSNLRRAAPESKGDSR
jgi:hypothetical protein